MKLVFSGRLQGVYQPKEVDKFPKRVPLNLVGRGVVQVGSIADVGVTCDQVSGYRSTLWVSADEVTAVYDRLVALVGRHVTYEVDHVLVPVKLPGSTLTNLAWRDTVELDSLVIE